MLLFSDYCLSCLETTTARQGKKVWILNGMKNLTAALLPASTVRQFLERQGWMLGSMLNCVENLSQATCNITPGEQGQYSRVEDHCKGKAHQFHWGGLHSAICTLPWCTDGCEKSQKLCVSLTASYHSFPVSGWAPALHSIRKSILWQDLSKVKNTIATRIHFASMYLILKDESSDGIAAPSSGPAEPASLFTVNGCPLWLFHLVTSPTVYLLCLQQLLSGLNMFLPRPMVLESL